MLPNHSRDAPRYIAVDIGGSGIKSGLVTADGRVLDTHRAPSHPGGAQAEILADIHEAIRPFKTAGAAGIGVGFPSFGDYKQGILWSVLSAFPSMDGFPLQPYLSHHYRLPVRLQSDSTLMALGILQFGEGQEIKDFMTLNIGSGTGVSLIKDGQLLPGVVGYPDAAVELFFNWPERDHMGWFFRELYGMSGEEFYQQACSANQSALAAFHRIGKALGATIQWLRLGIRVETVIIGGGVAESFRFFRAALEKELGGSGIHVFPTRLTHPSLLGAVALFR